MSNLLVIIKLSLLLVLIRDIILLIVKNSLKMALIRGLTRPHYVTCDAGLLEREKFVTHM